jgi:hypothetical protein
VYIGIGSVRLCCRPPSRDISIIFLHRVLYFPSLQKSLNSWNSVKLIRKFALIDDGILEVVRKIDRSVVINTIQFGNHFVLDLVPSESASLVKDTDYDFRDAALGHLFKANLNWKIYERWILDSGLSI